MSARSQRLIDRPDEGFNLGGALRDSFSPGILIVSQHERILSSTPEIEALLNLPAGSLSGAPFSLLPLPVQKIIHDSFSQPNGVLQEECLIAATETQPVRKLQIKVLSLPARGDAPEAVVTITDQSGLFYLQQSV